MWILFKLSSFIYHVSVKSRTWYPMFYQMITSTSEFWYQIRIFMKEFSECFNQFVVTKSLTDLFSVIQKLPMFIKILNIASNTGIQNKLKNVYPVRRSQRNVPVKERKINNRPSCRKFWWRLYLEKYIHLSREMDIWDYCYWLYSKLIPLDKSRKCICRNLNY